MTDDQSSRETKGYVRLFNLQNGLVAVETNKGFTIFEILDRCSLDISDQITGSLDTLGIQTLHNVTKKELFDVSIENVHCNWAEANQFLSEKHRI